MKFKQRSIDASREHLPLVQRLRVMRGEDPSYEESIADLLPPTEMKDVFVAASEILSAIESRKKICIVADYDADGATSCAIGLRGLRMFGADVSFVVPNRHSEGYGISRAVIDRVIEMHPDTQLLVTVDNGISALDGVAYAYEKGLQVVITDHHLAGPTLPVAEAIVNPNQPDCPFKSKNLAGCGVMFYVLVAMRQVLRKQRPDDARCKAPLQSLLDIVALGTVADVVQLDRNNRILVDAGLKRIRSGNAVAGIRALFAQAGRSIERAGAMDLGFYIGPRINAAGRMDDASVGIDCLTEDDPARAMELAESLHQTNLLRRAVQEDIQQEAQAIVDSLDLASNYTVVAANADWHEGVIGIVAGRLKEEYVRPVIVFTRAEDGSWKGSGRSIPQFHLRDALARIDALKPGLIKKFGGHSMAAGLSIDADRLDEFKLAFEDVATQILRPEDLEEIVEHDGYLGARDLDLDSAISLSCGVWGQGFPAPSFLVKGRVKSVRILKDKHSKMSLDVGGVSLDAIAFNEIVKASEQTESITLHGVLDINEWNGNQSLQFVVRTDTDTTREMLS